MTGFSGILLIIALVLVSGFIAYIGDIIGRRMGRKRLTLLGLRPRHTAIVISVLFGMLITLVTLAVAMVVSEDVKDGFLRVDVMRRRQVELSRELTALNERIAELEDARQRAEDGLRARRAELERTRSRLSEAEQELAKRRDEVAASEAVLERAEEAALRVARRSLDLARRKDDLQRDIEALRAQAAGDISWERATPIIFGAGEPLDWRLIRAAQPKDAIKKALERFVADLDDLAKTAGAEPLPDDEQAVVIRKPVRDPESESVAWFDADHVLSAVAERIAGSDRGVIVRAFSVFNTHPGEPVRVDFELFRNHLVFRRGDVLAETVLDGRLSEPVLFGALFSLLRDEVGAKALANNVMPRPRPSDSDVIGFTEGTVGEMSVEELFRVVDRIREIAGRARVTAVAAADTWTIGPLEVDLLVAPIPD